MYIQQGFSSPSISMNSQEGKAYIQMWASCWLHKAQVMKKAKMDGLPEVGGGKEMKSGVIDLGN